MVTGDTKEAACFSSFYGTKRDDEEDEEAPIQVVIAHS